MANTTLPFANLFDASSKPEDFMCLAMIREDQNYSYGERGAEMLAAAFIERNEALFREFLESLGIAEPEEFFRCGLHHWLRRVAYEHAAARAVTALGLDLKGSLATFPSSRDGNREADYQVRPPAAKMMMGTDTLISQKGGHGTLAHYDAKATYCPMSSHAFAEATVTEIFRALPDEAEWCMSIGGGTPPYAGNQEIPAGHLEIELSAPGRNSYCIGLIFGVRDDAGLPIRQPFSVDEWLPESFNPWADGLVAVNFDEAWRIVVLLAKRLGPAHLMIDYGLGI